MRSLLFIYTVVALGFVTESPGQTSRLTAPSPFFPQPVQQSIQEQYLRYHSYSQPYSPATPFPREGTYFSREGIRSYRGGYLKGARPTTGPRWLYGSPFWPAQPQPSFNLQGPRR